ncbi:MAG: hypothetical protein GXC73_05860, partial [Chitinophagaceae bacterium]|nr:hypothetical protein [Chitinophagaceae bacterium]
MQQLLNTPVTRHALNAWLTPFYFLFQPKKHLLRFALLVMSAGMMSGVAGQATVTSDKDDYAPRSNAVFTGAGFQAFEQVQLKVKNLNSPCNTVTTDSSYLSWIVTADASGAFVTNWTVCDCPGDSLRLKAVGLTSGLIAYAYFTDGNVEFKTTGLPTGSGVSVSYDYFPTGSGAPTLTAGSNTTDFTLVSRNNQLVRFSYPLSVIIGGELYNRTNVSINSGALSSGTNGFEFQFESPNASRIVTATYVICPKPVINTQPVNQTVTYGAPTISFTSTATNATDNKWQVNTGSGFNDIIPAETATTLTISNPTVAMSGYQYRMVATGSCGSTNSNTAILTVNKANPAITVNAYNVIYNGNSHTSTYSISGVNGETGAAVGTINVSATTHTNAGAYIADAWSFTGSPNYNDINGTVNNVISKAPSVTTVTINGGSFTYTGSAITPATVSVTGAGGVILATPTAVYNNNINAGTATASYNYAGDANHEQSSDSKNFTIDKANAIVNVSGYTGVYDGNAHGATGSATGVNGESLAGLDLGASFINVPGGTASWTFTDVTGNYKNTNGSVQIVISKAPSVTTVTINGGSFTYTGSA